MVDGGAEITFPFDTIWVGNKYPISLVNNATFILFAFRF